MVHAGGAGALAAELDELGNDLDAEAGAPKRRAAVITMRPSPEPRSTT